MWIFLRVVIHNLSMQRQTHVYPVAMDIIAAKCAVKPVYFVQQTKMVSRSVAMGSVIVNVVERCNRGHVSGNVHNAILLFGQSPTQSMQTIAL
mmetsp:Transcript_8489/g.31423  ORF Transcript_8489/g.31423 Transcript_8489/m.31423 type:complete len:93 (+) Transcript_8489:568-846(+)